LLLWRRFHKDPSLREILDDPFLFDRFLDYNRSERSEENLFFWKDAELFQVHGKEIEPSAKKQRAVELFKKYFNKNGTGLDSVNVGYQEKQQIEIELAKDNVDGNLFVSAQDQAYDVLLGMYPRFLQSNFYHVKVQRRFTMTDSDGMTKFSQLLRDSSKGVYFEKRVVGGKTYDHTFVGSQLVEWVMQNLNQKIFREIKNRKDAVQFLQVVVQRKVIVGVSVTFFQDTEDSIYYYIPRPWKNKKSESTPKTIRSTLSAGISMLIKPVTGTQLSRTLRQNRSKSHEEVQGKGHDSKKKTEEDSKSSETLSKQPQIET